MSDDRLPLPNLVTWPNFPFEGDMRVKEVRPYDEIEQPRSGEPGGAPCQACDTTDDGYIWSNERWRLKTLAPFSPQPLSLILETREHVDMHELDDDMASELGRISVTITRTAEAINRIGRVHTNRWGDGAEHFHIWYLARPYGAQQFSGFTLPMWGLTLPPLPADITGPINAEVVAALS